MINYHNFSSKNQVSRRRHGILIKTLFLFLIACSTCITALLWGQSAAFSRPPACPTGNAANFPSPPLSQNHESVPSLWLAQKEFGGKLLDRWFVDRGNTSVIIIVNRQLWSLLDYIERYQLTASALLRASTVTTCEFAPLKERLWRFIRARAIG
jgi:hypothetical protein